MAQAIEHMARAEHDIEQGNRIKELRAKRHMTQQQLADRVHVDKRTLQFWEAGTVDPSYENKKLLARALGSTVDYISNGPEEIIPADPLAGLRDHLTRLEAKVDELLRQRGEDPDA